MSDKMSILRQDFQDNLDRDKKSDAYLDEATPIIPGTLLAQFAMQYGKYRTQAMGYS